MYDRWCGTSFFFLLGKVIIMCIISWIQEVFNLILFKNNVKKKKIYKKFLQKLLMDREKIGFKKEKPGVSIFINFFRFCRFNFGFGDFIYDKNLSVLDGFLV